MLFLSLAKSVSKDERKLKQGYLGKEASWKYVVATFRDYHDKETMCWLEDKEPPSINVA